MDPLAPYRGHELDAEAYLKAIAGLAFDDVVWTEAFLSEMRDFLGPWQHNIRLPHGVHTAYWDRLYPPHQEIMRVVARELGGDFRGKKVLDLGCLDGYFAVECALQGAAVTAVDGKVKNLKKCEFVRSALGIEPSRLGLVLDDVMNVSREKYGGFDGVLVLGLLYHLANPFDFLARMAEICDGFVLIDTHVALADDIPRHSDGWRPELSPLTAFAHAGKSYPGRWFREFATGTPQVAKDLSVAASLTDDAAVWLLETSLVELLHDVGFDFVAKVSFPKSSET